MVSSDPANIHSWLSLDFSVIGEGEETVLELANAIRLKSDFSIISGIIFNAGDRMIHTSERISANNIDDIPYPDYLGFNLARYLDFQRESAFILDSYTDNPRVVPIMVARSCPFKCTFCSHTIKKYRKRKLDAVFEEIEFLVSNYGANGIGIYDDLFATDPKTLEEFCSRILPTGLNWGCQIRADIANRTLFKSLLSSGCNTISYGFESLHDDVLKSMKKQMSAKSIKAAAKITYESKLFLQANFIFGDSAETFESIDTTLNWWAANRVYGINLTTIQVFPGTAIYDDFVNKGVIQNKLEYVETGLFSFVNGTKLSFSDYFSLVCGIRGSQSLTIPCVVIKIELTGGNNVKAEVICPHCGETLVYGNLRIRSDSVMCRVCFAKFQIPVLRALGRNLCTTEQTIRVTEAIELIRKLKYAESKDLLETVVAENVLDVDAITALATTILCLRDFTRARELFWRALSIEPANAVAQNNLGVCLIYLGLVGWGLQHFKQAVYLDNYQPAQTNAEAVSDWLQKKFDIIPFLQKLDEFPNNTLIAIPTLSDGASCLRRAPIREILTCHQLLGAIS